MPYHPGRALPVNDSRNLVGRRNIALQLKTSFLVSEEVLKHGCQASPRRRDILIGQTALSHFHHLLGERHKKPFEPPTGGRKEYAYLALIVRQCLALDVTQLLQGDNA